MKAPLPLRILDDRIAPGDAYLSDTPLLRAHAGTQPDLYLCWNAVPLPAASIDIVVFLHGFSQQGGDMQLVEKVGRSGLDLSARSRPTLALLPRGNWIRHSWYDFPALLVGGFDRLVGYGLEQFAASLPDGFTLGLDRLILTAHSGGGMPAVDALADATRAPDEVFIFDGLYGRDPQTDDPLRGIEAIDHWLDARLAREPESEGALRVVYIERQTGEFSREVGKRIARRLGRLDPVVAERLAQRYKVERSGVPHAAVAERCLPELLARADVEFDWLA